ncbi:hypothetical protein DNTS_006373 [Danionella cerebrum]|uniref:Uncharacterized protein n=1 Tax=Danionella cerebrum TaxID=2873325 RepID=A0A553RPC8_9TELE|nr:hypothetical protein DNTS_006373 [Danionella translucida]
MIHSVYGSGPNDGNKLETNADSAFSHFPNLLPPPIFFNPTHTPFAPLVTPASLMPHENLNLPPVYMPEEWPSFFVGYANLPVAIKTPRRRRSKKRDGSRPSRTQMWLDNILADVFESVDFTAADGEIVDRLDSYLHKTKQRLRRS